ncbi:replication initiator [Streptomyces sp. NPDC086766]|uniref:replication initiator n=1 Tax=Streptomyces sp. NPDC086766 TaxID=3365754 RepID=UPI003814D623
MIFGVITVPLVRSRDVRAWEVFVTLTAPSFGPVHRAGELCRPRRDRGTCEHGRPLGCGAVGDDGAEEPFDPMAWFE